MTNILQLLILFHCHLIQVSGFFKWTVEGKATDYGQNVTLFCHVPNCCPEDAGWDRWTPQQRTLFIDVKTGRSNKKYDGKIFKNGYTLIIQNLTKDDLNVSYSCLYGVTLGERKFLQEEDVFTYTSSASRFSDGEIVGIIVGVVILIAVALAVSLLVCRFFKDRKKRNSAARKFKYTGVHQTDTDASHIDLNAAAVQHKDTDVSNVDLNTAAEQHEETDCFLEDPIDVECIEGKDVIFTCKVRDRSPPLKWLKGCDEILNNENCEIYTENSIDKLKLKNAQTKDSGEYRVQVGQFSRLMHLEITEKVNEDERNSYIKAIEFGSEVREYVRIQVIGKHGVGKTSLVSRLLGNGKYDGESTDGIEINRKCQIKKKDGEWIVGKVDTKRKDMIRRILQATKVKQKGQDQISGTSTPHNKLQPTENLLKKMKKQNIQEPNQSQDHLPTIEKQEPVPSEKTGTEGLDEQPKANVHTPITPITSVNSSSKPDEDQLIIEDTFKSNEESKKTTERKVTKTPEQIPESSNEVLDNTNVNANNADDITEAIIENLKEILSGAKFEKDKMTSDGLVECGIWDFAGQKDYYATHQTFFTPHAIYLMVADITEDIQDIQDDESADFDKIGEYIGFWLDSIHCFCTDPSSNKLCPPVIMVCTGIDKVVDKVDDRKMKYEQNFIRIFGQQKQINHRREIYFISNINPDEKEIDRLKKCIWQIATEINYFSETHPTRWINLENALEVLKDVGKTVYPLKNTLKLAQECSIDEKELVLFLNYHHKIGNIIFFDDKPDYIILQPNWLVECFRCLVCDDAKLNSPHTGTEMFKLKVKGELSETLLEQLFKKDPDLNFGEYRYHILDVMEKFDIIVKPQFSRLDNKFYYMPCRIETSSTLIEIKADCFTAQGHCTPWLVLEFEFLPVAYYNHIMYDYIRQYKVCTKDSGHPAIYKGKTVVYLDVAESKMLIICFSKNAISLQIWEWQLSGTNAEIYENILREICDKIDKLEDKLIHNLHYKIKSKCSSGDYSQSQGRISYKELTSQCIEEKYNCKDPEHKGEWHNKNEIENTWLKYATAIESEMLGQKNKRAKEREYLRIRREKEDNADLETEQEEVIPKNIREKEDNADLETEQEEVIPKNIRETLSENDRKSFMERIHSGHEIRKYVRIQVIGKKGVGKTSLVRRLLNQDLKGVTSTDGIDISRKCHIKESDGTWIFDYDQTEMEKIGNRILHATGNQPKNYERHTLFETEKNETPKDAIMLTVDETKQHPSNRLTNITGSSFKNSDDNQLHEVDALNSNADKPMTNTYTNYNADRITEAIVNKMDDITSYLKNKKATMTDDGLIECGIWDFAGQKEYHATHQTFLTTDAIYLLVADIKDELEVHYDDQFNFDSSGDYIDFWLDSIHCYCGDIKNSIANGKKPSVIMVCTGIDKLNGSDKDIEMKKKEYQNKFLATFGCQEKGSHVRFVINFISNIKSPEEDFTNLRDQISVIAKEMSYFAEKLPTRWIQLENTLAVLKELKKREKLGYCEKLENIEKLAKPILIEKDELLIFLKFQHKIGNVIFFEDKSDYVILQPKWLVDCFRCLICDNAKKYCTATELYNLYKWGKLSDHVIDKLFSKVPELMFGQFKPHILEVMEKFDIVVKPKSLNAYYIPCMITEVSSLENIKAAFKVGNHLCTPWLVLAFKFLPIAYYNHILFMYIREKTVCIEKSQTRDGRPAIYAGKAVVYLDKTKRSRLFICFSRNSISLQIWNNKDMDDNTYRKIIEELCKRIEDLETKLGNTLQYKIQSKCSTGDYVSSSGRISHEDLNELWVGRQYFCEEHECMHTKDDIENTWFKNLVESTAESTDKIAPKIKPVNSTQEIIAEPNQPALGEDLLDASCITDDAAKYSNTKLLITAQNDISSDLEQKLPCYSEYESLDTRLNSFESWSSSKKPTREDLARAGFFYLEEGDKVKCFYCAGILMQWKEDDVPIEEHKRYYPACPFIKNIDK